jgi:thiosulfate reductase cytochrome b subunit
VTPLHSVSPDGPYLSYYRHTLPVRLMHWINVVALSILLMSGLQIFNAHPALYWGKSSYSSAPPLLEIGSRTDPAGGVVGFTRILGREFRTTGVLGASYSADGSPVRQAFPGWIALPSRQWLAMARTWHFFFAWILVINGVLFVGYAIGSRHLTRDLAVSRGELGKIPRSVVDHLHFRHATGDAAKRYNVLQKLAYLAVIFGLLPLIVLMGLAMSPWLNSLLAGWVDIVGGRQSARTLHFVVAWLLVAFAFIHVFQVLVTGAWNNLRSMITGTYRVGSGADGGDHHG